MVKLLSIFKAKKFLIPGAIGIVFLLSFSHIWMYQKGKEAQKISSMEQTIEALEAQRSHLETIHSIEIEQITSRYEKENQIIQESMDIDINVDTPECSDLGDDWLLQYNSAIQPTENP